jgi:flagella basal body P-ring formation protein FlgA
VIFGIEALSHGRRLMLVGILTFAAGALTVGATAEPSQEWQSPESIRAAARDAATNDGASAVEALAVDERLKLPQCGEPLETRMQRAVQRGQGTVAVSCPGPDAWRLFVPVRVNEEVAVLVARRSLQPGDVLSAADLEVRRQTAVSLPYDYLSDPEQAVGLTVRRSQPVGTVLVPAVLEHPAGVERGALVTLISGGGPVTVRAEGVALEPARLGERVRVRSQSGRVVEGWVEAPGQVRVGT